MTSATVLVYRNPVHGGFTVRNLADGARADMREMWLRDARFEISHACRLRALREGRKTLHACVVGTLLDAAPAGTRCDVPVHYRPRHETDFTTHEGCPVRTATFVHMINDRVFIPIEERWL